MAIGEAVVGALRVVLGMDTSSFEDGAKRAASSANSFGTQLKAVFAGVGLERIVERVFDFLAHTFVEGVKNAFEFADQMGKMAQKVGLSVEELSGLKVAADVADVSMETLATGLGILSKNMVKASQESGDARDNFAALGIKVVDAAGNLKSTTKIFGEIADKFEDTGNGAAKTAAAMNLLGRSGKELIPLLNDGSEGIEHFTKVAENMGLVVSQNTSNQTQKFNDNLKILGLGVSGVANLVLAELIPGLLRLSQGFVDTVQTGEGIRATADSIVKGFKSLVEGIFIVIAPDKILGEAFNNLQEGLIHVLQGIFDVFAKALQPIDKFVTDIVRAILAPFEKLGVKFVDIGTQVVKSIGGWFGFIRDNLPAIESDTSGVGKAFDDFIATLSSDEFEKANVSFSKMTDVIEKLKKTAPEAAVEVEKLFEHFQTGGKKAKEALDLPASKLKDELDRLALSTAVLSGQFDHLPEGLAETAARLGLVDKSGRDLKGTLAENSNAVQTLGRATQLFQAQQIAFEELDPFAKYIVSLERLQALRPVFTDLGLDQDLLTQRMVKNAAKIATTWGDTAAAIVNPIASAFKTLAESNKKYAATAKAAAIAEALVNTYLAATKAFAQTPGGLPFQIAAAAAATAAGLVMVAKIASTPFAQGGSFKVGGVGGIDSQLISLRATPGEMVDVRKPGSTTSAVTEITVNMQGRDLINKDMVRDLFTAINEGTRDGYRLKLAEA